MSALMSALTLSEPALQDNNHGGPVSPINPMIKQEDVYRIGRLGKAHGVKGEISLLCDDDVFDRVDADYLVLDVDGILVPFFIEEYRFRTDSVVLVKFDGIDTQERARELTGSDVYFPRALADESDSPSLSMLVGFAIVDADTGKQVGSRRISHTQCQQLN